MTSYSVRSGDAEQGVLQFAPEHTVTAGVGEAGAPIPPFEYHILRNAGAPPAATLHVHGGELTSPITSTSRSRAVGAAATGSWPTPTDRFRRPRDDGYSAAVQLPPSAL